MVKNIQIKMSGQSPQEMSKILRLISCDIEQGSSGGQITDLKSKQIIGKWSILPLEK